jgi:hypothetical protein
MKSNLNKIAQDLYGKIETRFPNIKIGDENAGVLSKKTDIPEARFFEFEYENNGVSLGTVTITLDEDDGVIVQIGEKLAQRKHHGMLKFIRGLRTFAKLRLLNFDVQNIGKDNLDKRDYQFQAKPKEEPVMQTPVMESKFYGTSKISYQDLGEARLIIKHNQPVNLKLAAGRTLNVEAIYVENLAGERFKYPFKHINGARALAEHIKHGGNPYDSIGVHITGLSEELAQLRKFKGYVSRNDSLSEAMTDITPRVLERIDSIKKEVNSLQRSTYYEQFAESFTDREDQMIPENIMSDWIDRLTIRTFNEELKTAFPYIFRLVDETQIPIKELNPDDLLDEVRTEVKDKDGNVVSWSEKGEWKKADKKDPKGKIFNLSDKARRETEKLSKKEKEVAEGGITLPNPDGSLPPGAFTMDDQVRLNQRVQQQAQAPATATAIDYTKPGPITQDSLGQKLEYGIPVNAKGAFIPPNQDLPDAEYLQQLRAYKSWKADYLKRWPNAKQQPDGSMQGVQPFGSTTQKFETLDPEGDFDSIIENIFKEDEIQQQGKNNLFSKNLEVRTQAFQQLKQLISSGLQAGVGGMNAISSLAGIIDSENLTDELKGLDGDDDAGVAVKLYLKNLADDELREPLAPDANEIAREILAGNTLNNLEEPESPVGGEVAPDIGAMPPPAPAPAPDMGAIPAPDMGAMPAPDMGAMPPPAPAPVSEGSGNHSRSRIIRAIHRAKDLGATLDTTLDFGHKEMTLHDAIRECGLDPKSVGFDSTENEDGTTQLLKVVVGFFNREKRNFTIGGERAKIKVVKAFKNEECPNASEEDLANVLKIISRLDPSDSPELGHIKQLSGIAHQQHEIDENPEEINLDTMLKQLQMLATDPNTQKQLGQQIVNKVSPEIEKNVPNQTIQFPGGQMNPAELMKAILSKLPQN